MKVRLKKDIPKHQLAQLGKNYFFFFCRSILGYDKLNSDNAIWCNKFQKYVEAWEESKASGKEIQFNSIWLEPRETYKSTVLNVSAIVWLIIRNPNISIILVSKILDNAEKFLREIKKHLESNEKLIALYGDYKGDNWTTKMIIVSNRDQLGIKEPTVQAVGSKTSLTSAHYDVGIFDDLVDGDDRVSAAAREATANLNKDLTDIIKRNGFLAYIGTRWHPNDLYHDIINNVIPNTKHLKSARWIKDIRSCFNADGSTRFKVLPMEILEYKKVKKGSIVFAANYENKPLASETQLFSEETIDEFAFKIDSINMDGAEILGFCDPAVGRTSKACYAPIATAVIVRHDESGNKLQHPILYVIDFDVQRRTTSKLKNVIALKHQTFGFFRFGMESNAMQSELADNTEEKITELTDVDNLYIEQVQNKINKEVRIESLEMPIALGYIRFRADWRTAENNYKEGIEQLLWYPIHEYRDAPDVLEALFKFGNKSMGVLV